MGEEFVLGYYKIGDYDEINWEDDILGVMSDNSISE